MGMKHKVKHVRRQNQNAVPRKGHTAKSVTITDSTGTIQVSDLEAVQSLAKFIEGSSDDGVVLSPLSPGQGTDDDEVLGDIESASRLESEYNPEED